MDFGPNFLLYDPLVTDDAEIIDLLIGGFNIRRNTCGFRNSGLPDSKDDLPESQDNRKRFRRVIAKQRAGVRTRSSGDFQDSLFSRVNAGDMPVVIRAEELDLCSTAVALAVAHTERYFPLRAEEDIQAGARFAEHVAQLRAT